MENPKQPEKKVDAPVDIAEQNYQGPSAVVVSFGRGAIDHLKWAFIGIGAFALAAGLFPKHAKSLIKHMRENAEKLKHGTVDAEAGFVRTAINGFNQGLCAFLHFVVGEGPKKIKVSSADPQHKEWLKHAVANKEHGFGRLFTSHILGNIPFLGGRIKTWLTTLKPDQSAILTFGGIGGLIGYIGGWVNALFTGHKHANRAKEQFHEAKQEVIRLRTQNAEQASALGNASSHINESAAHTASEQALAQTLENKLRDVGYHQPSTRIHSATVEHSQQHTAQPALS